jgi:hypothetical protein
MILSRLLYVSRCAFGMQQGPARDAKVREIAAQAARRNAAVSLTGTLLYVNDSFVQVLEGPPKAVERTFEAICCDFRHEDVKLIDLVPVKERVFCDWNMAVLGVDGETTLTTRDDLEEIRFLVGVNAREAVGQMRRLLASEPVS